MAICPNCGARNPRENTVCRSCGAVLGLEPSPAAPTTPSEAGPGEEADFPVPARPAAEEEPAAPPSPDTQDLQIGQGVLFGLGASIIAGVAWYLLYTYLPEGQKGFAAVIAFAAGWGIAEAVRFGAGRKRGRPLQLIALGLTALTIIVMQVVILTVVKHVQPADLLAAFWQEITSDVLTLMFLLLGLWQAYNGPAPRRQRPQPQPEAGAPAGRSAESAGEAGEGAAEAPGEEGTAQAPAGAPGLTCARCKSPTTQEEALLMPGRGGTTMALCPKCVAEFESEFAAETQDVQMGRGVLFGVGAAIAAGGIWYLAETLAKMPLAFMAWLGGWGIAEAVRFGAGRKRGRPLQLLAVGLTVLLILGTQLAFVLPIKPAADVSPAWSPDGTSLAFQSNREGNPEIYVLKQEAGGLVRLTNDAAVDSTPTWSPDSTRLAFQSQSGTYAHLYVVNADGSGTTRLTDDPSFNGHPAWSPDGTRIAFQSDRDGNSEIYVMNADGSNVVRLTDNPAADGSPAWSLDGTRIVFQSDRDGNNEIYAMNDDGSAVIRLSDNAAADEAPAWSLDGTRIAFQSNRDGNWEIYVMNSDGSAVTRLTDNPAADEAPSWSPDSALLAFQSNRDNNWEIYMMKADGSTVTRVTDDPTEFFQAVGRRMGDPFTILLFLLALWQAYTAAAPRRLPGRRPAKPGS